MRGCVNLGACRNCSPDAAKRESGKTILNPEFRHRAFLFGLSADSELQSLFGLFASCLGFQWAELFTLINNEGRDLEIVPAHT